MNQHRPGRAAIVVIALGSAALHVPAPAAADDSTSARKSVATPKSAVRSKRVGEASVYDAKLVGRKMADGTKLQAHGDSAASKTLPLGTKAKVTNLENGKSAEVTIRDRGPYVKGRIIDLSPSTAQKIGIGHEEGVGKVEVTPVSIPEHKDPASH